MRSFVAVFRHDIGIVGGSTVVPQGDRFLANLELYMH